MSAELVFLGTSVTCVLARERFLGLMAVLLVRCLHLLSVQCFNDDNPDSDGIVNNMWNI